MSEGAAETSATAEHRLAPLFNPASIAVIGASGRAGRPGNSVLKALKALDFPGALWPVNPNYEDIDGLACFPDTAALPGAPDLALIAGATERMEEQLAAAIACGARSAMVFAHALLAEDTEPPILDRVGAMARETGLPLAGPYTIGYVNYADRAAVTWAPPLLYRAGHIAAVLQSGATFGTMYNMDPRVRYNLIAHPGQEAVLTIDDYMDYMLELPTTRALGLYLETVRDPDGFVAALEKAHALDIPVVALKSGRGDRAARMVMTHSGGLAGDDGAIQAVFDRYGVARVHTMDEWLVTLTLMAHPHRPGPGGLAAITDSGGQRNVLFDLAQDIGLDWAEIGPATTERIRSRINFSLLPMNPLDAWGGEPDWTDVFKDSLEALLADPATAIGLVFTEFGVASDPMMVAYFDMLKEVAATAEKPVMGASFTSRQVHPRHVLELDAVGIPVLDGSREALGAVKHAFAYRDFRARAADPPPPAPKPAVLARWRARLGKATPLDEAEGLALLADFGIPVADTRIAESAADAVAAAAAVGYPVALKAAMAAIAHKTEAGGVVLDLADAAALEAAYAVMAERLGPRVLVAAMAPPGTELALGIVRDDQFGPLAMVGAGGILVESLRDVRFAIPPFGVAAARRLTQSLGAAAILAGVRGRPAADLGAVADALARLSVLAHTLGEALDGLDVNPLIAGPAGSVAVDALVVPRGAGDCREHFELTGLCTK